MVEPLSACRGETGTALDYKYQSAHAKYGHCPPGKQKNKSGKTKNKSGKMGRLCVCVAVLAPRNAGEMVTKYPPNPSQAQVKNTAILWHFCDISCAIIAVAGDATEKSCIWHMHGRDGIPIRTRARIHMQGRESKQDSARQSRPLKPPKRRRGAAGCGEGRRT